MPVGPKQSVTCQVPGLRFLCSGAFRRHSLPRFAARLAHRSGSSAFLSNCAVRPAACCLQLLDAAHPLARPKYQHPKRVKHCGVLARHPNSLCWLQVKTFFHVGTKVKKLYKKEDPADRWHLRFEQYREMLNLFTTKPVDVDAADLPAVPSGCWLRPTLAAAVPVKPETLLQLQRHIVPGTLADHDILISLYWDLELDLSLLSTPGFEATPEELKAVRLTEEFRQKKGTIKMACSILTSCHWGRWAALGVLDVQPGRPRAPPVVVICDGKADGPLYLPEPIPRLTPPHPVPSP